MESNLEGLQSRLKKELAGLPDHEGFMIKSRTQPQGEQIVFRDASELAALMRLARSEEVQAQMAAGTTSPWIAECGSPW